MDTNLNSLFAPKASKVTQREYPDTVAGSTTPRSDRGGRVRWIGKDGREHRTARAAGPGARRA